MLRSCGLAILAGCQAHAQSDATVEFEVVSIKPSPPPGGTIFVKCDGGPGSADPTLFHCQNLSLTNLISRAYQLNYDQVSGPDWLRWQMFDLMAKVPAGTDDDQFRAMLRNVLAERFKMTAHRDSKELTVFDLVVAKGGPKLKATENSALAPASAYGDTEGAPAAPRLDKDGYPSLGGRPGFTMMRGRARVFQPKWTLEALAGMLTGQLGRPVTNATGLTGLYEISLYWSSDSGSADNDGAPTLMRAIQEQLGLRLEPRKGVVDFLAIDHIEKVPTAN